MYSNNRTITTIIKQKSPWGEIQHHFHEGEIKEISRFINLLNKKRINYEVINIERKQND